MTAPANDNWADAEPLSGLGELVSGLDTTDATFEVDEPAVTDESWPDPPYPGWGPYDTGIGATVWFTWSPGTAGIYKFSTETSDFDTVVAVYTAAGTTFADLTLIAANDEAQVDLEGYPLVSWSEVTFAAGTAETYHLQVGGAGSATGNLYLTAYDATPPDNDDWASAEPITLSGGSATVTGSNAYSTTEPGETLTFSTFGYGGTVSNTVWYSWEADEDGVARFDTFGSDYDSTAAVFTGGTATGGTLSGFSPVAFNDDYLGGTVTIAQSQASWAAEGSTTYWIQVGGNADASGAIAAHLYFEPYPAPVYPDAPPELTPADEYRVELRSLSSSGFSQTTASLDLVTFSCNWRLNAPGAFEGTGVIGTIQSDAANVGQRELIVYKGSTAIWGGYLTFFDVDEDSRRVRISAEGYWSRARSRVMRGNQIYKPVTNNGVSWKADVIAWDIIDQAQGATYGDMGWSFGGHSGTRYDCKRVYYAVDRTNVASAIETLAREDYFDFSVDVRNSPSAGDVAKFRTWAKRGTDRSASIDLNGTNAVTLNYSLSSSDLYTYIDVFGSVEGCRGVAATDSANLSTYGRLEGRAIDMETDEQGEVDRAASDFIDQHSVPAKNASVSYMEGVGPDLTSYDIGDTIKVSPADGYVSYFTGRVISRELAVEARRAVITVEVER